MTRRVDASAKKIGEVLVWDCEGAEREALCRREPDTTEPLVKLSIPPGKMMTTMAVTTVVRPDWRRYANAAFHCIQQIEVLRDDRDGRPLTSEIAIRRDQADDVCDVGGPATETAPGHVAKPAW